jgi:hypothetical protein
MLINCVAPSEQPKLMKTRSPISRVAPEDTDRSRGAVWEMSLVRFPDPNRSRVLDLGLPPDAHTGPEVVGVAQIPASTKDGFCILPIASRAEPLHERTSRPPSLNAGVVRGRGP